MWGLRAALKTVVFEVGELGNPWYSGPHRDGAWLVPEKDCQVFYGRQAGSPSPDLMPGEHPRLGSIPGR